MQDSSGRFFNVTFLGKWKRKKEKKWVGVLSRKGWEFNKEEEKEEKRRKIFM